MAQSDLTIQNQSFPSFRSDLNDALSAINSMQSGTNRPASAVAGTMWLDTTNPTNPVIKFFDGIDDITFATVDYSANTINFSDSALDLVTDTTPQLGGMLDVNGQAIGDGTLELIKFLETASAVNEITVTNSATGTAPEVSATGDDTDVDLKITPKGAGNLILDGFEFPNTDGTAGQVLQTDGYANLSFGTVGGGGKVLQVVQGTSMVRTVTTSTSFVNTNVTVNITPSSASNKILITGHTQLYTPNQSSVYGPGVAIKRNSTEIWKSSSSAGNYYSFFGGSSTYLLIPVPFGYLDSPSSTSSITYALAISSFNGTSVEDFAGDLGARYTGVIIAMEIEG